MVDKKINKRVKTPTILQMEAVECGAACLGMILAYHGKYVPLEELRTKCGVSRDGSNAANVVKAARKYGFDAQGYRKDPETILDLPLPLIIHWNFNHFLVFEGIKKNKVYLNDPGPGSRTVCLEEFNQSFTGICLSFKPNADFKKQGKKPSILNSLKSRFSGCKIGLLFTVIAGLFLVLPQILIPIFSKIFIDKILIARLTSWIHPLITAMVITAIVYAGLYWLQANSLLRMRCKIALFQTSKFFYHVFRLPIDFFSQRFSGDISSRVALNDAVAQLLSGPLTQNIIAFITIVFYAFLMFSYNVTLTFIGIFSVVLNLVALKMVSKKRTNLNMCLQQEHGKLTGVSMNGLQMIETLKATGSENEFFSNWAGYQTKIINTQQKLSLWTQLLDNVPVFLSSLNHIVIILVGSLFVIKGDLALGMLVAFQILMGSFIQPVNKLVAMGSDLQDTHAYLTRLDDVLNNPEDPSFSTKNTFANYENNYLAKLSGKIDLKNITFGYSPLAPPLIENFEMSLKPGSRVAFVGATGSGKSTLAKLLTGLYKPWQGEILFDNRHLDEWSKSYLKDSVGVVDQEIFIFEGTVIENLSLWDKTIAQKDIICAAKDACIHDDIASLASGYESNLIEGGNNFSGGQRQRLEIARALTKNPTILILDEATSALDPETEKAIDDNLRRRGCTCVIVAHRLSTIRDVDEIIVLDNGKVIERGTHEQLRDKKGLYFDLIQEQ